MIRIAISLLILILSVPGALACSCMPWPPPLEALDEATAVFTGRIIDSEPTEAIRGFEYTIEVHSVWKGVSSSQVLVTTDDIAMCGLWMEVGKTYLVYSYGDAEAMWTHNCSRSRDTHLAEEDILAFGEPITVNAQDETFTQLKVRYE
jgi:hypothetical protein